MDKNGGTNYKKDHMSDRLFLKMKPVLSTYDVRMVGGIPNVVLSGKFKDFQKKVQKEVQKQDYKLGVQIKIVFMIYTTDQHPYNIFACANSVLTAIAGKEVDHLTNVSVEKYITDDLKKTGIYIENRFDVLTNLGLSNKIQ